MRYAEIITSLIMLKSFVDLNKNSLKKMQNANVAFGVLTRNLN